MKNSMRGAMAFLIAVLLIAACGGTEETESVPTKVPPTQAPAVTVPAPTQVPTTSSDNPTPNAEQPIPTEPEVAPTSTAAAAAPTSAAEDESGIPFNVPVLGGALDTVIQRDTGSVTYLMEDMLIDDVIEFYKTEMVAQGWEEKTSSTIGMMATLVFETDQARTSVSLQANEIAKTVNVRLFIFAK